jgi:hypothetical protein
MNVRRIGVFGMPALLAVLLVLPTPAFAAPPLPGAIFTTTVNGTVVNGNIYAAKCDVYLDGGPGANAPQTAAGLPDGDYYFQVTDPSGKVLLSTDPVANRRITVSGGIIVSAFTHSTGLDADWGAATVQLCNFKDTPNNGGEYKVWVTPVGDFVGDPNIVDNGYSAAYFHGFIPAASKTDNFKVKARAGVCLTIKKFIDFDEDGKPDSVEPYVQWPVFVTGPLGDVIQGVLYTGSPASKFPDLKVCNLGAGTYVVSELVFDGWNVTSNIVDKKYYTPPSTDIVVTIQKSDRVVTFGNADTKK